MAGVAPPRFARTLAATIALGAPFVLVAAFASSLVTPLTAAGVAVLLRVTAPLVAKPAAPLELEPVTNAPVALTFETTTKATRRGGKAPAKPKPSALFVSEAVVLELARSAARPSGAFVQATEQHPAGLRLTGVAALGVGLHDGDILIEALGATPRAPEQVIGAVIEARAKRARFLTGTVWRAGQTFRITVEQPYLREPA